MIIIMNNLKFLQVIKSTRVIKDFLTLYHYVLPNTTTTSCQKCGQMYKNDGNVMGKVISFTKDLIPYYLKEKTRLVFKLLETHSSNYFTTSRKEEEKR